MGCKFIANIALKVIFGKNGFNSILKYDIESSNRNRKEM